MFKKFIPFKDDPVHVFKIPFFRTYEPSVEIVLDSSYADVTIIRDDSLGWNMLLGIILIKSKILVIIRLEFMSGNFELQSN